MKISILPRQVAIWSINGYQRYISPYKGFHCAYAQVYGGLSCSVYGKRVIQQYGLRYGFKLLNHRFHACREAMLILKIQAEQYSTNCSETCGREMGSCGHNCGDTTHSCGLNCGSQATDVCINFGSGFIQGCCGG